MSSPRTMRPWLCTLGVIALCTPAVAQQNQTLKGAADAIKSAGNADVVDPASIDALKAMGQYLAAQTAFDFSSRFEVELPLDNDQKVEIGGTSHYVARRPDGLRVELNSDLGQRTFVFNGKSLYVVAPENAAYGQLDDVGPTIKDMLEQVSTYSDIELPLSDLFDLGTADDLSTQVVEGFLVGPATIDGQATKHWAYRTADRDFEVWIADGAEPLPLKLVVEDVSQSSRPRFESNLDWTEKPVVADADFTFTPPPGTTEIPILVHAAATEDTP